MVVRGSRRARRVLPVASALVGPAEREQASPVAPEQGQEQEQERQAPRAVAPAVAPAVDLEAVLVVVVVLVRTSVPGGRSGVEVLTSWSRSRRPVTRPQMLRCRKARYRCRAA